MMEHEAKLMEEKLVKLKQFVEEEKSRDKKRIIEKKKKTRWDNQNSPIRQYGKYVLVEHEQKNDGTNIQNQAAQFKPKGLRAYDAQLKQQKLQNEQIQNMKKIDEVEEFFKSICLERYKKNFKLSGFNTISKLFGVKENEMDSMGVLPGHQIKIMKMLRKKYGNLDPNRENLVRDNYLNNQNPNSQASSGQNTKQNQQKINSTAPLAKTNQNGQNIKKSDNEELRKKIQQSLNEIESSNTQNLEGSRSYSFLENEQSNLDKKDIKMIKNDKNNSKNFVRNNSEI